MGRPLPFSGEPGALMTVKINLLSPREDGSFVVARHITYTRPLAGQELQPTKKGVRFSIGQVDFNYAIEEPILIDADGDTDVEENAGSQPAIANGFSIVIQPRQIKTKGKLK